MHRSVGLLFIVIRLLLLGCCQELRPLYVGTKPGDPDVCFTCEWYQSEWNREFVEEHNLFITEEDSKSQMCFKGFRDYQYYNFMCNNFTYFLYSGTTDRLLNEVGDHDLYSIRSVDPNRFEAYVSCYAVYPGVEVEIVNGSDFTAITGAQKMQPRGYKVDLGPAISGAVIVVRGSLKDESGQVIKMQESRYKVFSPVLKLLHRPNDKNEIEEGTDAEFSATIRVTKDMRFNVTWIRPDGISIPCQIKLNSTEKRKGMLNEKYVSKISIKNATKGHSGMYSLSIEHIKHDFFVSVTPKIHHDRNTIEIITQKTLSHLNHKSANLEIQYVADQIPVITWYDQHDNKIQTSKKYIIESTDKQTRLLINNLQIHDNGNYTVQLSIRNVTRSVTIPLTVVGIQDVTITSKKYIPIDTQVDNVTCQVYSNPAPQFTWIYQGELNETLQNYTVEEIGPNHYLSRLWYEPVDLLVTLTCKTDNEHDSEQVVENIYKTNVINGFDILPSKEELYVGDDFNLTCYTDIYSYSHFINWTLPSNKIMFNIEKWSNSTYYGSVLLLKDVTKEMSGEYVCNILINNKFQRYRRRITLMFEDTEEDATFSYKQVFDVNAIDVLGLLFRLVGLILILLLSLLFIFIYLFIY